MNIVMRDDLDFPYVVIADTFDGDIIVIGDEDDYEYEADEPCMDGFGPIAAAADEAALIALYGDTEAHEPHDGSEPAYVVEAA